MGAGKTSMLNALVRAMPPAHRVLGCEVTRELSAPLFHGDYYKTRQVGVGSKGETEITLRELVHQCLGMRADVLVVGEVRGAEAYELTRAGNAGCGLLCTIHANGPREAMNALVNTALLAGENVPAAQIQSVFADIIDLVVHLDREDLALREGGDGGVAITRQVLEIARCRPCRGPSTASPPSRSSSATTSGPRCAGPASTPRAACGNAWSGCCTTRAASLEKVFEGRMRRVSELPSAALDEAAGGAGRGRLRLPAGRHPGRLQPRPGRPAGPAPTPPPAPGPAVAGPGRGRRQPLPSSGGRRSAGRWSPSSCCWP